MSYILAIETSLQACSVALITGEQVFYQAEIAERQQSQHILALINQVMVKAKISLDRLDAIAFSSGPGSFTGIRLAAVVAQGIALAENLPLIPVSTLRALAQSAYAELAYDHVLVAVDARRAEIYWGVYQLSTAGIMQAQQNDSRCNPNLASLPLVEKWVGVGDGWDVYAQQLHEIIQPVAIYPKLKVDAKQLAKIAAFEYVQGNYVLAEEALPNYLLDASAWS